MKNTGNHGEKLQEDSKIELHMKEGFKMRIDETI